MTKPQTLGKEELQKWLIGSPFIEALHLEVISADVATETVVMKMPMRPEFERIAKTGQWHGGPIASAIDTVGDFGLVMLLGRPLPTVNFRVDYLRPAINTALILTAKVRRNGKSVGIVDVDVTNEAGVLLAIGRATYSTLT